MTGFLDKELLIIPPKDAIAKGVGFLTEDRKRQGLLLGMSVKDNSTYTVLKRLTKGLFVDQKEAIRLTEEKVKEVKI